MGLWGNGRPLLETLASEAQAIVLAMPPSERESAMVGLGHVVTGVRELLGLPDELVGRLFKALAWFMAQMQMPASEAAKKTRARELILQLVAGAPELLGPHKAEIEAFLA